MSAFKSKSAVETNITKQVLVFGSIFQKSILTFITYNWILFMLYSYCTSILKTSTGCFKKDWIKWLFDMPAVLSMDMLESNLKVIYNITDKEPFQVLHTNPDKLYIKLKAFISWVKKNKKLRRPFGFHRDMDT
jgi:hypothetical protein